MPPTDRTPAQLRALALELLPYLRPLVLADLEPALMDAMSLAARAPTGPIGTVLEPGTVQDTNLLEGTCQVLLDSGASIPVEGCAVLPAQGERVYVEFHPPAKPLLLGRVRGQPQLLGRPGVLLAPGGTAGVGGLTVPISTGAVVQNGRLVAVTGHVQLEAGSAALEAYLDVYDNGVLAGRADTTVVASAGTGILDGHYLAVAPAAGIHVYELVVTTSTGTVDVVVSSWVLAQDVGSANLV